MSTTHESASWAPIDKPDDYYNPFPSTVTYDGSTYSEAFKTDGRWCESEEHPRKPHGPLPTGSSHSNERKCIRYVGGRVVDRSNSACWHKSFFTKVFGDPSYGSPYVPHCVGSVQAEVDDTSGAVCHAHQAAVALAKQEMIKNLSEDEPADAYLDKILYGGDKIGPEDWFVYVRDGSQQGDSKRHMHSE